MVIRVLCFVALALVCCVVVRGQPTTFTGAPKPLRSKSCFNYNLTPLLPRPAYLDTCCWYQESNCCYWTSTLPAVKEMREIVRLGKISQECYTHLVDIMCSGCAPNTLDYVKVDKNGGIRVTMCRTTCAAFYAACSQEAASFGINDETQFCEDFHQKFLIDDDADDDDDLFYDITTSSNENCYRSFSMQDGGAYINSFMGVKNGRCIAPLMLPDGLDWSEYVSPVDSESKVPSGIPDVNKHVYHASAFDFPFSMAPITNSPNIKSSGSIMDSHGLTFGLFSIGVLLVNLV